MQEVDGPGQKEERLQMLQVKGAIARSHSSPDVPSRKLEKVSPITWVHVPKCGSSFLNTIIHLPGVCPNYTDDVVIDRDHYGTAFLDAFKSSHDLARDCPGLSYSSLGHEGVETWPWRSWKKDQGHLMIMLRNPEQRLLSAYKDMVPALESLKGASLVEAAVDAAYLAREDRSWGGWPSLKMPTPREFAEYNQGCATRMIVQGGWACAGSRGPPSLKEMDEAKRRLREGFAFVGITDKWALSICLLSKMYEVPCHAYQFADSRPGPDKADEEGFYPDWPLEGFKDKWDGELYKEALSIFNESCKRYDVSEATCETCYMQAGISSLLSERKGLWYQDQSWH